MVIEKLKYFIDLYENGSYTKTAKMNYISQTSVSQFIHSLEAEFNIKLFNRSTLPITPTPAGKRFYLEARSLWKQYDIMKKAMLNFHANPHRPLRIFYTSKIEMQIVLPCIQRFHTKYPDINVEITKIQLKDAVSSLLMSKCDIATGIDFDDRKPIKTCCIYKGHYDALVSSRHDLYHNEIITTEELYHYPLIMLSEDVIGKTYHTMINNTLLDGYYPNIVKTTDDIETELFIIITDNLIGFAPDNYSLDELEGSIRKIPIQDSQHQFELLLGYIEDENPSTAFFIQELQSYLKNQ